MKEHRSLVNGRSTWFWCAQDEAKKRNIKKQHAPAVKNRDTEGMDRFSCDSRLRISVTHSEDQKRQKIVVSLQHCHAHVAYYNTSLPKVAEEFIKENLWASPSAIASKIRDQFPHLSAAQVYTAWSKFSEVLWNRAANQLDSAKILLSEMTEEADLLDIEAPDGVVALGWGLPRVANRLKGKIMEVVMDATCMSQFL